MRAYGRGLDGLVLPIVRPIKSAPHRTTLPVSGKNRNLSNAGEVALRESVQHALEMAVEQSVAFDAISCGSPP